MVLYCFVIVACFCVEAGLIRLGHWRNRVSRKIASCCSNTSSMHSTTSTLR